MTIKNIDATVLHDSVVAGQESMGQKPRTTIRLRQKSNLRPAQL